MIEGENIRKEQCRAEWMKRKAEERGEEHKELRS